MEIEWNQVVLSIFVWSTPYNHASHEPIMVQGTGIIIFVLAKLLLRDCALLYSGQFTTVAQV